MSNRPRLWDETILRQAFDIAQKSGVARVELPSNDYARKLRQRLYDFRNTNIGVGDGIVITLDQNFVILTKSVPSLDQIKIEAGK